MSEVTFKRIRAGHYESSNGWTIWHDNDWAGLWSICPTKPPREGRRWKVQTAINSKVAKQKVAQMNSVPND